MLCLEAKKAARPTRNLVLTIHSSSSTGEGTGSLAGASSWPNWLPLGLSSGDAIPSAWVGILPGAKLLADAQRCKVIELTLGSRDCLMSWRAKRPNVRENVRENVRSLYSQGSDCRVIFSPIPVESFPFAVLYPTNSPLIPRDKPVNGNLFCKYL